MNKLILVLIWAGIMMSDGASFAQSDGAQDAGIEIGRYARAQLTLTPELTAEIQNPMKTVVSVSFAREQIETVGDAAEYLLIRSGYRLDEERGGDVHARLLAFPLPESQRRLQHVRVEEGLLLLGGQAYAPVIDHVQRTVAYVLRNSGEDDATVQIVSTADAPVQYAVKEN